MKGYLAAAAVLMAATAATAQNAALKVAVIDVQQVVEESAAGKEAMARLKKLNDEKTAQGKKMVDELDGLQRQLQTQQATLTDAKVAELRKQIEDKQVAIKRFDDDAQREVAEARRKELQQLENQILPIINAIGKEMKLELIFNKYQSGLVYADEAVDITDQVLRRFNTQVSQ